MVIGHDSVGMFFRRITTHRRRLVLLCRVLASFPEGIGKDTFRDTAPFQGTNPNSLPGTVRPR